MCMQHTLIWSSLCKWKRPKLFFLLVNGTQYARPKKWRYAVRKANNGRYAVRNGGGGVTLNNVIVNTKVKHFKMTWTQYCGCTFTYMYYLSTSHLHNTRIHVFDILCRWEVLYIKVQLQSSVWHQRTWAYAAIR